MNRLYIGACLIFLCGCQSIPPECGVKSNTTQDPQKEITVFTRDGIKVLKIYRNRPDDLSKAITRQEVYYREKRILDIIDIQGRRSFLVKPNTPVSVGATVDNNGQTTDVIISGKDRVVKEWFMVKDTLLYPVSNEELARAQSLMSDIGNLFDPDNMKRLTKDEFVDQAVGVGIKHKKK